MDYWKHMTEMLRGSSKNVPGQVWTQDPEVVRWGFETGKVKSINQ